MTDAFKVGDAVMVLAAIRLPQEYPIGAGRIHKVTYQSSDGEPLYWVTGFLTARTARVLRPSHVPDMMQESR